MAQKFGSPNQKFRSADQNFSCLNPHHFLIGLTEIEGQTDQNFTLTQPNCYLVVPPHTKSWKHLQNFYECTLISTSRNESFYFHEIYYKETSSTSKI